MNALSKQGYVTTGGEPLVKQTTKIYGFAVVQVGRRMLIEACQEEEQEW